jgi:hypothetical protein
MSRKTATYGDCISHFEKMPDCPGPEWSDMSNDWVSCGFTNLGKKRKCTHVRYAATPKDCCLYNLINIKPDNEIAQPEEHKLSCNPMYHPEKPGCLPIFGLHCDIDNIYNNEYCKKWFKTSLNKPKNDPQYLNAKQKLEDYCKTNWRGKTICKEYCTSQKGLCTKILTEYCSDPLRGFPLDDDVCKNFCKLHRTDGACDELMTKACRDNRYNRKEECSCFYHYNPNDETSVFHYTDGGQKTLNEDTSRMASLYPPVCTLPKCMNDGFKTTEHTGTTCPQCLQFNIIGDNAIVVDSEQVNRCANEVLGPSGPPAPVPAPAPVPGPPAPASDSDDDDDKKKRRQKVIFIIVGIVLLIMAIIAFLFV